MLTKTGIKDRFDGTPKYHSNMKLKNKLITSFFILTFVPVLFMTCFSYLSAKDTVQTKALDLVSALNSQIISNIDSEISKYELVENQMYLAALTQDDSFMDLNFDNANNFDLAAANKKNIDNMLNSFSSTIDTFKNYGILTQDKLYGGLDSTKFNSQFYSTDTYKKVSDAKGKLVWITNSNNGSFSFYTMRIFSNGSTLGSKKGVMITQINPKSLDQLLANLKINTGSKLEIADKGTVIYTTDLKDMGKQLQSGVLSAIVKDNDTLIHDGNITSYGTAQNGWKVVILTPISFLTKEINTVGVTVSILGLLAVIVAMSVGYMISNGITKPIHSIAALMKKAENGDLTVKAEITGKSEVGTLAKSFNLMLGNIKALLASANNVINEVSEKSKTILEIARMSSNTSEQVALAIGEIARGSTEQAKGTEEATDIMNKLARKIGNVTENMTKVSELSDYTTQVGDASLQAVSALRDKSGESGKMVEEINANIILLNESAKSIQMIVNVLKSITDQTNLLSLNASIEAARAGEAGKGFAVVANEVRMLAEQSKRSTEEISSVIKGIQANVTSTVELVDKATEVFKVQEVSVEDTNKAFTTIIESANCMSAEIEAVKAMISEIESYKENAIYAISSIASVSEQTSASSQEVSATTEEQASGANELSIMVGKLNTAVETLTESMKNFRI